MISFTAVGSSQVDRSLGWLTVSSTSWKTYLGRVSFCFMTKAISSMIRSKVFV